MGVQSPGPRRAGGGSDLLAVGFGTTVAMWAVGYVGHMPLTGVPPLVFASLMLVCVAAGGWFLGRYTPCGLRGGLAMGLLIALLNLLILGSVLAEPDSRHVLPQAWIWVPCYFVVCMALAALGTGVGTGIRQARSGRAEAEIETASRDEPDWIVTFTWIACLATLLLIVSGGLVTGLRAGMAVDDWPGTFGWNMYFYPFAKMTGGVFYEHSHRLMGSLVGLTTLALAILLTLQRRSMGALILVWTVGVCVALQGVMGGFRVTENNTDLAVVHGFFAHLILAGLVGVAALAAPRPEGLEGPVNNETDCLLSTILVLAILLQTLVGTFVRQKNVALVEHISLAMAVIIFTIIVGVRLWGLYPHIRVFARGGVALMSIVLVQLLLGGISLAMRTPPAVQSPSAEQLQARPDALQPAVPAILTTAHQTTAAVLLGIATLLAFWCWRLVWSGPILADEPSPAPDGEQL